MLKQKELGKLLIEQEDQKLFFNKNAVSIGATNELEHMMKSLSYVPAVVITEKIKRDLEENPKNSASPRGKSSLIC